MELEKLKCLWNDCRFSDITMNSLKVSWDEPKQPNGEITGYVVTYETAQQDETFSKQVKQKVTTTWLVVGNLEEEVTYYFSVRASTYELGAPSTGNVTTGPQEGSPGRLKDLLITRTTSAVNLQWENGPSGKGPIMGYYIESNKKGNDRGPCSSTIEVPESQLSVKITL
jgi:protein sidekick